MSIADIIKMIESRLATLNGLRGTAVSLGDLSQLNYIDAEIQQTTLTLDQLKTLA
jgi:hypothetical protein